MGKWLNGFLLSQYCLTRGMTFCDFYEKQQVKYFCIYKSGKEYEARDPGRQMGEGLI